MPTAWGDEWHGVLDAVVGCELIADRYETRHENVSRRWSRAEI